MKSSTIDSCEILIGCFTISFLLSSVARLSSIYFVESITRYNVNRRQASLPFVLTYLVRNLSGPVIGYLEQIFGIRLITLIGCIVGTISIGACYFAEDIIAITILWGALFGLSYGFTCQMIPSLLNHHFPSHKGKVNGFAFAGACIGSIILPPIMEACIHSYGISGSFLILSAILAHSIPASLILKDPKVNVKSKPAILPTDRKVNADNFENETADINKTSYPRTDSGVKLEKEILKLTIPHHLLRASEIENIDLDLGKNSANLTICDELHYNTDLGFKISFKSYENSYIKDRNEVVKVEKAIRQKNFSFQNFKIFLDPTYILLILLHASSTLIITTMWTIVLDFIRDKGVDQELEIYSVMCLPLADLVGRFGSGFIIDRDFLTTPVMGVICFFCSSLSIIMFIFVNNYILILIAEVLMSIFLGSIIVLETILIHEFMEESKRTMAMTCRYLLYAPLSLSISPMIGYFRGNLGSYDSVFYILCGISFVCGCAIYFIPHLARRRRNTIP